MIHPRAHARGTILIIIAGMSALMAVLALGFFARMRSDAEEQRVILQETQARIMLSAACSYIQEASRLGYGTANYFQRASPPARPAGVASVNAHEEAYGWIDVRDGSIGPRTRRWDAPDGAGATDASVARYSDQAIDPDGNGGLRPAWPAIGGVIRSPMHVLARPPFAVRPATTYNPISMNATDPAFGLPLLRHPDPQPQSASWNDFVAGDRTPRETTRHRSWFRILRDGPATFVVTCGAGASDGFRSWRDVVDHGHAADFGSDPALWQSFANDETRLWFRVEWSAAAQSPDYQHYNVLFTHIYESYYTYPINASTSTYQLPVWNERYPGARSNATNPVGTIQWTQRLLMEPSRW